MLTRAGTLAAAAAQLGIDASTVHRRLAQLERAVGTRLLERRGRGTALTAAGERLVQHASRVEDEVLAVQREVLGRDIELAGTIRVTAPDDIGSRLLPAHVAAFRRKHPAITIELVLDNRVLDLVRGEADIAIRPRRPAASTDIVGRRVSGFAGALYASRAYLAIRSAPRRRSDLSRHDLVAGDGSLAQSAYGRILTAVSKEERVAFRSNSMLALWRAAALGLGVAALPCFLGDSDPDLVRLFGPEPELGGELWLLYHGDLRQTARVRAFSDFLFDSIRGDRALLEGARPRG